MSHILLGINPWEGSILFRHAEGGYGVMRIENGWRVEPLADDDKAVPLLKAHHHLSGEGPVTFDTVETLRSHARPMCLREAEALPARIQKTWPEIDAARKQMLAAAVNGRRRSS